MDNAIRLEEVATVRLFCTGISQLFSVSSSWYQRNDTPSGGKKRRFLAFNETPVTITSGPHSRHRMVTRKVVRKALLILFDLFAFADYHRQQHQQEADKHEENCHGSCHGHICLINGLVGDQH